jgi:hypothetical protein
MFVWYLSTMLRLALSTLIIVIPCPKRHCIRLLYIDSPSVARGLRYFSTQESEIKNFNHSLVVKIFNLTLLNGEIS